jgi:bifunctional enzyme CysN/CysC
MPWYEGPALLEHLETVPVEQRLAAEEPFRMAVQWVNRPDQNFRGYAGRIASGRVRAGDEIAILPAGRRSRVARIVTFSGDLAEAVAGQSVTLTLADEVDCSRGDVIAAAEAPAQAAGRIGATLVWMSDEAMVPHRSYWLKIGAQTLSASIGGMGPVTDVNTMEPKRAVTLGLNDIGRVEIDLDRDVPAFLYAENRRLGGFILIDKLTHATVAAGLVESAAARGRERGGHADGEGAILWIAGPAREAAAAQRAERLRALGHPVVVLSEETMRGLAGDDSAETVRRAREAAKLMSAAGIEVLVTLEASEEEAHPGRRVDAGDTAEGPADDWVI